MNPPESGIRPKHESAIRMHPPRGTDPSLWNGSVRGVKGNYRTITIGLMTWSSEDDRRR